MTGPGDGDMPLYPDRALAFDDLASRLGERRGAGWGAVFLGYVPLLLIAALAWAPVAVLALALAWVLG